MIDVSLLTDPQPPTTPALAAAAAATNQHANDDDDNDDAVSVATTALASEVGSFVGYKHDAFLRSITFYCPKARNNNNNNNGDRSSNSSTITQQQEEEVDWKITFRDGTVSKRRKKIIEIDEIGGIVSEFSKLKPGDRLKYINGKKMGPSYNAERATQYLESCLETQDFISVAVGNDEGNDIMVQATVIKPKPNMTYKEMGVEVWVWGRLCIKSIAKESLFRQTVLKSSDHIVSINDIDCEHVSPEGFAHIITELPNEITIVVKRGKQRWTGKFG